MHLKIKTTMVQMGVAIIVIAVLGGGVLMYPIRYERSPSMAPDIIVVLGGGGGHRVAHYARHVYPSYPNVHVVYTGGVSFYGQPDAAHMAEFATQLGVAAPSIQVGTSQSTMDDAIHSRRYFRDHNIMPRSMLLITSDFHTRRAWWTFKKVFPEVDIYMVSVPHRLTKLAWWRDYNMAQHVLEEKARGLFYRLVVWVKPSILDA